MKTTNILLLVLIVIIVAAVITSFVIFKPAEGKTVEVSGSSEIEEQATISTIYLGYQNVDDSAQVAEQENAKVISAIKNALIAQGLEETNIETDSYYLNQEYEWIGNQRVSKGYRAYHRLKITVEDVSVGKFITAAVNEGANFVDNIQYKLPDEEMNALKARALEEASQNARAKAESIAQGLNLRIKGIKSVQDTSWDVMPWIYSVEYKAESIGGQGGAISTPAPVEIGKVTVTASVRVIFEIA